MLTDRDVNIRKAGFTVLVLFQEKALGTDDCAERYDIECSYRVYMQSTVTEVTSASIVPDPAVTVQVCPVGWVLTVTL